MGSLIPDADLKQGLDDSGYVQDGAMTEPPVEHKEEEYKGMAELLDLSDDVLLYILRECAPEDLKALGFTCPRLGSLVLDRSLWVDVSCRAACGRRRMRWFLSRALGPHTRRLRLQGYAPAAEGCLGFVNRYDLQGADESTVDPDEERFLCADRRVFRLAHSTLRYSSGHPYWPTPPPANTTAAAPAPPTAPPIGTVFVSCPGPQLTLTHTGLRTLSELCCSLRILELENCVIDCQTTNIGMFPKTLTKLSLRGTKCFNLESKSFLFKIQDHLTHLEELDVSHCSWIEPACMLPLSKMPCLRVLGMQECHKLAEFVAYASLACRYGFKKLKILDLRGSPVGDSEVSSLGWLPSLEELYLSPSHFPSRAKEHAHYSHDLVPKHIELEEWEETEPDYFKPPTISEEEWLRDEENVHGNRTHYYAACRDDTASKCILLERMIAEPVSPEEYAQVFQQFLGVHNNAAAAADPEHYRDAYRHYMEPAGYSLFIRRYDRRRDQPGPSRRQDEPGPSGAGAPARAEERAPSGEVGPARADESEPNGKNGTSKKDDAGPSGAEGPLKADEAGLLNVKGPSKTKDAGLLDRNGPLKANEPPSDVQHPIKSDEAERSGVDGPSKADNAEPAGVEGPLKMDVADSSDLNEIASGADKVGPSMSDVAGASSVDGNLKAEELIPLKMDVEEPPELDSVEDASHLKTNENRSTKMDEEMPGTSTGDEIRKRQADQPGTSGSSDHPKNDSDGSSDDDCPSPPKRRKLSPDEKDGWAKTDRTVKKDRLAEKDRPAKIDDSDNNDYSHKKDEVMSEEKKRALAEVRRRMLMEQLRALKSKQHSRRVLEITINQINARIQELDNIQERHYNEAHGIDIEPNDANLANNEPNAANYEPNAANNVPILVNNEPNPVNNEPNVANNEHNLANNEPNAVNHEPNAVNNEPNAINNMPVANNMPNAANNMANAANNMPNAANNMPNVANNALNAAHIDPNQFLQYLNVHNHRRFQFCGYRRPIVIEELINGGEEPRGLQRLPRGLLFSGGGAGLQRLDHSSLITDSSIRRFGRAIGENINYIHIGGGDRDVNARPDRSSLRILSIAGFGRITDASLTHLATAAPDLRRLDVSDTAVTHSAVERFRAMRPEVEVVATATQPERDATQPNH